MLYDFHNFWKIVNIINDLRKKKILNQYVTILDTEKRKKKLSISLGIFYNHYKRTCNSQESRTLLIIYGTDRTKERHLFFTKFNSYLEAVTRATWFCPRDYPNTRAHECNCAEGRRTEPDSLPELHPPMAKPWHMYFFDDSNK